MSHSPSPDQAEGLRRILADRATRQLAFLSALAPAQKNAVLLNLAAALVRAGSEVPLLDASQSEQGIGSHARPALQASLLDVAQHGGALEAANPEHDQGIRLCRLSMQALSGLPSDGAALQGLSRLLRELSPQANFWLLDLDLDADNPLVLPELAGAEVVVLVANTPTSIKHAYAQVKSFHARFGRRPFHLLVVGASAVQAAMIEKNMALAANRYLATRLMSLGSIPVDEHLSRALLLGRSIVDAFPMAPASAAFRAIATALLGAAGAAPRRTSALEV